MTSIASTGVPSDEAEIAARVGSFFDDVVPAVLAGSSPGLARARAWRAALYDHGFGGINVPEAFGGHGDDPARRRRQRRRHDRGDRRLRRHRVAA